MPMSSLLVLRWVVWLNEPLWAVGDEVSVQKGTVLFLGQVEEVHPMVEMLGGVLCTFAVRELVHDEPAQRGADWHVLGI